MRLSKKGIESRRRGLIRSWQDGAHREAQLRRAANAPADTVRSRAQSDRNGTLLVGGIVVYHSTRRSDQLDVFVGGRLAVTGGPRVVAQ